MRAHCTRWAELFEQREHVERRKWLGVGLFERLGVVRQRLRRKRQLERRQLGRIIGQQRKR